MGLARATVSWLMEEAQRRPFRGNILTLGVQNVFLTQAEFEDLAAKRGVVLGPVPSDDAPSLVDGTVSAEHVFRRLGFDNVVTTDADPFEGCDLVFDLNAPNPPAQHRGVYDMVLDGGTLEHVFHVPNALSNLLAFANDTGRIVHQVPSSNHIDHGFWMFSPTLFWDYYTANGVELPRFDLFRYRSPAARDALWDFAQYRPNTLRKMMFGGLGGGCFGLAIVAEKTGPIEQPVIPQQGMYADAWSNKISPGVDNAAPGMVGLEFWLKTMGERANSLFPEEWRIRCRAATRKFPLPIRRRF